MKKSQCVLSNHSNPPLVRSIYTEYNSKPFQMAKNGCNNV